MPSATAAELALALFEVVEAGARVINLSIALITAPARGEQELREALNYAAQKGTIVVAAAGNQGMLGSSLITRHSWVIPIVAYDLRGRLMALSNLGSSIGRRGVGAPGEGVVSLRSEGGMLSLGGTSVATPFVTGAVALLWSCFPNASATEIKIAVSDAGLRRKTLTPPLLNGRLAYESMARHARAIAI